MMDHVADTRVPLYDLLAVGDPAALEYLYQYAPRLERTLQRRFGDVIAPEDIKDIVRDGLIRALRTGHRFDPDRAQITTWLNTLTHYEALDFLRRNLAAVSLEVVPQREPTPQQESQVEEQEPSALIARILEQLPTQRAAILRMHYYEGRSHAEIAQLLQISPGAVKSHLSHARSDIRRELAGEAHTA